MNELGRLIREARIKKGYSQEDLGKLAGGLSHTYISNLELGYQSTSKEPPRRPPLPAVLERIALLLDLDYHKLAALCGYDSADKDADFKALKENYFSLSPESQALAKALIDSMVKLEREKKNRG